MEKLFKKALFVFRRDLRLEDNNGLVFALENAEKVIPCFIFTPEQITHNAYRSDHCLQFMIESLEDLEGQLEKKGGKLFLFFDHPEIVVESCIKKLGVDGVVVNRDYTPYSSERDIKIDSVCKKLGVPFHYFDDALLHAPEDTVKADGTPYSIFTPFYRNASRFEVPACIENPYHNYDTAPISFSKRASFYHEILPKRKKQQVGGRAAALSILKNIRRFSDYEFIRDFPAENGTTHLSAHLKFTTCSAREVYYSLVKELGIDSALVRSLYWRDFFTSIAFHFPRVFKGAFHQKFDLVKWSYDKNVFKTWCEGKTGFPIVDAGMREMNTTGYMQNRVRMIVASFLVKDLHIDWRWGEKYFAQTLIDYDPAVNNGNWQWAASTGCDAQPYFRIFNPWSQQVKFDPECIYIKRFIPELSLYSPKVIHEWYLEKHYNQCCNYPAPMIDHTKESKIALASYKQAANSH